MKRYRGTKSPFLGGETRSDNAGQTAIYSAGEHLELRCGKARLVMTKDGKIFLLTERKLIEGAESVTVMR